MCRAEFLSLLGVVTIEFGGSRANDVKQNAS